MTKAQVQSDWLPHKTLVAVKNNLFNWKYHSLNTSNWALSDADTNDSVSEAASSSKSLLKSNNCNCSWMLSSSIHVNIFLGVCGNEALERPYCSITLRSFLELPINALSLSPASKIESSSCKVFCPWCVMTHSAASYQCSNAISKFFTPNTEINIHLGMKHHHQSARCYHKNQCYRSEHPCQHSSSCYNLVPGLCCSLPLEQEGRKRDPGNKIVVAITIIIITYVTIDNKTSSSIWWRSLWSINSLGRNQILNDTCLDEFFNDLPVLCNDILCQVNSTVFRDPFIWMWHQTRCSMAINIFCTKDLPWWIS